MSEDANFCDAWSLKSLANDKKNLRKALFYHLEQGFFLQQGKIEL
jgi:hypothetical protein